ncbi:hypothetical protein PFISCL1PPCAC_3845, partial [Pristionchus fissidentatus]
PEGEDPESQGIHLPIDRSDEPRPEYDGMTAAQYDVLRWKRIEASVSKIPLKKVALPTPEAEEAWKEEKRGDGFIFPEDRIPGVEYEIGEDGWKYQRKIPARSPHPKYVLEKHG